MKKPVLITFVVMMILAVSSVAILVFLERDNYKNSAPFENQQNPQNQGASSDSEKSKVSFPNYYSDELAVLGILTPVTETEYSLVFKSNSTASSSKPISAMTIQVQTTLPIFQLSETNNIISNNCLDAGWSELFNKQSTEGNTTFLRFGSVVMPEEGKKNVICNFFDERNPQLTMKTEFPVISTDFKGLVELIYADGSEAMGKIVFSSAN